MLNKCDSRIQPRETRKTISSEEMYSEFIFLLCLRFLNYLRVNLSKDKLKL